MSSHDVCIVGLGPTGLTLAHLLARRGLSVIALERDPEFYGMARAVYTDDECLRILQNAGVADELHAQMNAGSVVQWRHADGSVLAQFHNPDEPHGWPVSNFLYQPFFEGTLEARLADHPQVTVRRGCEVTGFTQDGDGVTVMTTGETVRASFLVGADGGRSTIRRELGIEMDGKAFPQRWLVIDLKAKDGTDPFRHLPYFDFVCDPDLPTVSCPQPDRRHRFEFMLKDSDATEEFEAVETAHRLMGRYTDGDQVEIARQLVYTFNALVAQRWREGRVLLAGDAAHMTPQFIGQGMNAGIRDADNLSWKLATIVRHGASASILDSYQAERKPHAKAMIDLSVFNKDIVSTQSRAAIRARDVGLGIGVKVPGLASFITEAKMKPKPRLKPGYLGLPRALPRLKRGVEGSLMPQPRVRTYAGTCVRMDDALGHGWVVLGIGCDPREVVTDTAWDELDATWGAFYLPGTRPQGQPLIEERGHHSLVEVRGTSLETRELVDLEGLDHALVPWLRRARAATGHVIVLRPDKYVFSVTGPGQHPRAADAAREQLGL